MPRRTKRRSNKVDLPPGSLVHFGEKFGDQARITVIDYNETSYQEREAHCGEDLVAARGTDTITWVNVHGLADVSSLARIREAFGLHPLVMEDVVTTDQRPKLEDFGEYVFVVLRRLSYDDEHDEILSQQVSIILGPGYVISFQEKEEGAFDTVRDHLKAASGRLRTMGAGYLAYSLVDSVVDHYFITLETMEDDMEVLEEEVVQTPGSQVLTKIHKLKNNMIQLRKSVWPLREVIGTLGRGETALIDDPTRLYFRDIYDHTIQIIDTIETFRDILSGMLDIYLSSVSNRLNEVMKVLTIIATIFMPLSFLAGVYGMNFKYFPEIEWRWGYAMFWGIIVTMALFMLRFFRRRQWL